jgi:hypothetical protein
MKFLDSKDFNEMGLFNSPMTLKRAIDNQGFPPGRLITPNCRRWTVEEVEAWIESRPSARKTDTRAAAQAAA